MGRGFEAGTSSNPRLKNRPLLGITLVVGGVRAVVGGRGDFRRGDLGGFFFHRGKLVGGVFFLDDRTIQGLGPVDLSPVVSFLLIRGGKIWFPAIVVARLVGVDAFKAI